MTYARTRYPTGYSGSRAASRPTAPHLVAPTRIAPPSMVGNRRSVRAPRVRRPTAKLTRPRLPRPPTTPLRRAPREELQPPRRSHLERPGAPGLPSLLSWWHAEHGTRLDVLNSGRRAHLTPPQRAPTWPHRANPAGHRGGPPSPPRRAEQRPRGPTKPLEPAGRRAPPAREADLAGAQPSGSPPGSASPAASWAPSMLSVDGSSVAISSSSPTSRTPWGPSAPSKTAWSCARRASSCSGSKS